MTRRDIHELEALFTDLWHGQRFTARRTFRPNVDCFHTVDPHELTVLVELPGVDPESIAVVVGERTLIVAGERARPAARGRVYQQMEIEYGPFQRQVRLHEDVDPDGAHAEYERGILRIALPVTTAPLARGRVSITVHIS